MTGLGVALFAQLKWVALVQIANLLLPILLFPVLAQRLGVVGFAVFAVLTGISQYATLGVELGFNHVGLARIRNALRHEDRVSSYSAILTAKLILACLVLIFLYALMVFARPLPEVDPITVVALSAGSLLTCVVYPAWFFTLIERQDVNFKVSFFSRLILLVAVVLWIRDEQDVLIAVGLFNFAFMPLALLYVPHWWNYLGVRELLDVKAVWAILRQGVGMSGAMIRETVTSLGLAPLFGLFETGPTVGILAFAEKVAKIIVLPAPVVASVAMVGRETLFSSRLYAQLLRRDLRVLVPAQVVILLMIAGYWAATSWAIDRWFSEYASAKSMIGVLVLFSPFVYLNYIMVAIYHTASEKFRLVGRLSYLYVLFLGVAALTAGFLWGAFGLVVVTGLAELILVFVLIRVSRDRIAGDHA